MTSGYWQPADIGVDPDGYADGQIPVFDDGAGQFVPGVGGGDLSDDNPQPVADEPTPGVSDDAARADHVHALGPLDSLTLVSPDGTLWEFTVDNTGTFGTAGTEIDARITDQGTRITGTGGLRIVENV